MQTISSPATLAEPKAVPPDNFSGGGSVLPPGATFFRCRTLASFLAFIFLNLLFYYCHWGSLKPSDFPFPTWTGLAISDFIAGDKPPANIVFIGSSLVLSPLGAVDADLLKKPIDAPRHHKSLYFERAFYEKTGGVAIRTFNFALPGEMPSDASLIADFLFKGDKQPDIIIYGVGPRDFMDNLLPSPAATDPFTYISRFGDYRRRIDLIAPSWPERLAYELGQHIFFCGARMDLSHSFNDYCKLAVNYLLPSAGKPFDIGFRRLLLPEYHPFEVGLHECLFHPSTGEQAFVDNIDEYRKRYKKLKWDTFNSQMTFLSDLLNTARQRGVHVVLLAMPITDINKELLGNYAFSVYADRLRSLAMRYGAYLIDLENSGLFNRGDFSDTVHLNAKGGVKMLDAIASQLAAKVTVKPQAAGGIRLYLEHKGSAL